jgi:hypothetical protein
MRDRPTLTAEDTDDLDILSARLQDAVVQVKDLVWLPASHRFMALFNRFKWESAQGKFGHNLRVRSRLCFERVLGVRSHRVRRDGEAVASLLAMIYAPRSSEDPSGVIKLLFAGGGVIRLDVECLDASLADVSGEWAARGRPDHETEGR